MKLFRNGWLAFPIFDGYGAALKGGRWNRRKQRVIYCAENLATCRLELRVHLDTLKGVPTQHAFIEIDVPDDVTIESLNPEMLPLGWDDPDRLSVAQRIGDAWYRGKNRSAILRVPSVAARGDWNVLINQEHPDFRKIRASEPKPLVWDKRLFR